MRVRHMAPLNIHNCHCVESTIRNQRCNFLRLVVAMMRFLRPLSNTDQCCSSLGKEVKVYLFVHLVEILLTQRCMSGWLTSC